MIIVWKSVVYALALNIPSKLFLVLNKVSKNVKKMFKNVLKNIQIFRNCAPHRLSS